MELEKKFLFYVSLGLCERLTLANSVDSQGSLEFGCYECGEDEVSHGTTNSDGYENSLV